MDTGYDEVNLADFKCDCHDMIGRLKSWQNVVVLTERVNSHSSPMKKQTRRVRNLKE